MSRSSGAGSVASIPQPQMPGADAQQLWKYKIKGYQRVPKEEEWFWVMYGCNNGQCDGSVATISNQPFVNEQIPQSKDTFTFFQGEVMAGKPWLCIQCHQRVNLSNDFSFGDYVWKLKPFAPK